MARYAFLMDNKNHSFECRVLWRIAGLKITRGRRSNLKEKKNCFKRSKHRLFWHASTLHYSFRTCRTSDRYEGTQYTWPGGSRGKRALLLLLLQKRGISAYTQIKLLDINDLRYLSLENRETSSHSAFTDVNNHLSLCLLQCSVYSIHKQLNQL